MFRRQPAIVDIVIANFDVLSYQPHIVKTQITRCSAQLRSFEKLRGRSLTTRSKLVGDLSCAAFLLEKLLARLAGAPLSFTATSRIRENCFDKFRRPHQTLLIDRDQFEKRAVRGRSGEFRESFVRCFGVEYNRFVDL